MPTHNYTPRQALDLLLAKIQHLSPELYQRMRDAIDAGKDVQEQEPVGRRRVRSFRKNVPYTDEGALEVAMTVLESHLIETRKVIGAADSEFTKVELAPAKRRESNGDDTEDIGRARTSGTDAPKVIEIEVEPETVLEKQGLPDVPLKAATTPDLEGLEAIFRQLRALTHFQEDAHGNPR
jgi:hypothetical protein